MILKDIIVGDIRFKIYVNPEATQLCQRRILSGGRWEPWVTKFLLDSLKEDTVFIDAGASIGWFALLVAASPKVRVIAYEPDEGRYSALCKSKAVNNFDNMVVFNHALMDSSDNVGLGGRAHAYVYVGDGSIAAMSLDNSLKSISQDVVDLVKIDVEGAELRVLKGMTDTIMRNPQIKIIVETHPRLIKSLFGDTVEELFDFMEALNFKKTKLRGRYWVFQK